MRKKFHFGTKILASSMKLTVFLLLLAFKCSHQLPCCKVVIFKFICSFVNFQFSVGVDALWGLSRMLDPLNFFGGNPRPYQNLPPNVPPFIRDNLPPNVPPFIKENLPPNVPPFIKENLPPNVPPFINGLPSNGFKPNKFPSNQLYNDLPITEYRPENLAPIIYPINEHFPENYASIINGPIDDSSIDNLKVVKLPERVQP